MKVLIAVVTCHKNRSRADAQRDTWAQVIGADIRFFLGDGDAQRHDEVILDAPDDYEGLPTKVQAMLRWALARGYDYIFKCDDDVYLRPERLLKDIPDGHDYYGRKRCASGDVSVTPAPYASGFSYWLSAKAAAIVVQEPMSKDPAEDRFVGNALLRAGLHCTAAPSDHYVVVSAKNAAASGPEGPRVGNNTISACEYHDDRMHMVHHEFLTIPSEHMTREIPVTGTPMDKVCIMIKTFLRDGFLYQTIADIKRCLPGARMIIVDDGYAATKKITLYAQLEREGHSVVHLPFDSGFGAKSNAAIGPCDRPYLLVGSDDFDFAGHEVRRGIEMMVALLDSREDIGVASGRVDNTPYEGYIERGADYIREHRLEYTNYDHAGGVDFKLCDLTVNYSLLRASMLGPFKVHWHEHFKIGGDHYTFFDDVRRSGGKIAWIPGVNINQQKRENVVAAEYPEYGKYRGRARQALPMFFHAQRIKQYVGFDGRIDTLERLGLTPIHETHRPPLELLHPSPVPVTQ